MNNEKPKRRINWLEPLVCSIVVIGLVVGAIIMKEVC